MNLLAKSAVALTLMLGMSAANAATKVTFLNIDTNSQSSWDLGSDYAAGDDSNTYFNALTAGNYSFSITSDVSDYVLSLFNYKSNTALASTTNSTLTYALNAGSKYTLNYLSTSGLATGVTLNVAAVPEPETYALMGVGLLGLLAARRRKAMAS